MIMDHSRNFPAFSTSKFIWINTVVTCSHLSVVACVLKSLSTDLSIYLQGKTVSIQLLLGVASKACRLFLIEWLMNSFFSLVTARIPCGR